MQFLGICPFLGVSKRISTAVGMAGAVAFVMVLATIVTYLIQNYVLNKLGLAYLQTIAFILVIAALVQLVEIILKKASPALYQALGIFLPLITTNCAILGVAILVWRCQFLQESVNI
jgi:electron transport complex protein RnfA